MAKLKYWRFWLSDFYGSDRVDALSGTVRRIYMELLAFEARAEGKGLPNDPPLLAKRLDLTTEEFENAWREPDDPEGVSQFFVLDKRGRLFNPVCEKNLAKDLENARTFSERGQEANRVRWRSFKDPSRTPSSNPIARMRDESLKDELPKVPREEGTLGTSGNLGDLGDDNGENSAARAEAHYNDRFREVTTWLRKHGFTRPDTLQEVLSTGIGPEDIEAWETFRHRRGEAKFCSMVKSHKNPCTVPAEARPESFEEAKRRKDREEFQRYLEQEGIK